jgi:hypothetical protein
MPPLLHRPLNSTRLLGIRVRPYDRFVTETTVGAICVWLGTYRTPEEVSHAFDAATWRFGWGGATLIPEIQS